ncbi:MAG: hypothetical protein ACPKPY_08475 [Nitrososphaeraceae archaeon]
MQIKEIKKTFETSPDPEIRKKCLDALEIYGNEGIPVILDLIRITMNKDVKSHGLDLIKKMENSINTS